LKVRIFTLAKVLDMDSKVLVDYCQKVGIVIKSSALASITPEERDKVLAYIKQAQSTPETARTAVAAPTRESPRVITTKVPRLKVSVTKPPAGEGQERQDQLSGEAEVAGEPSRPEATDIRPDAEAAPTIAAGEVAAKQSGPDAEAATRPTGEAGQAAAPARGPALSKEPSGGTHRREDYVPASGTTSARTMMARGTVSDLATRIPRKPKERPGPALPKLADLPPAPTPAALVGAKGLPAQKPELRLSREILADKQRPLSEHLRQHAEDKKRKKKGDVGTTEFVDELDVSAVRKTGKGEAIKGVAGAGLLTGRKDRQARRGRSELSDEEVGAEGVTTRLRPQKLRARRPGQVAPLKTLAEIEPPITVRTLSEAIGRPARTLLGSLMTKGQMLTINASIDEELAVELALECGVDLTIRHPKDIVQELERAASIKAEGANLVSRPPIITILGHVDHGKTTLLDKIRSANVAAGEVGGITQHIAAYQIEHDGKRLTFLDTPGHAAFAEMRARGANLTDIAVLVVAANDGVMPQTIEALNHARAAEVPIVVAMNKVDLPDTNEQRVLQELAAQNLLAAEWGGDTEVVRTSGLKGTGIEGLLETLLTIAELHDLTADPSRHAHGICVEAFLSEGRGVLAWLIVQDGTLHVGDVVLCGESFGRIRSMYNDHDQEVQEVGPSTPVKVSGLDVVPSPGDKFFVMQDLEQARDAAERRRLRLREKSLTDRRHTRTLQDILQVAKDGEVRELPLILKCDTPGSIEALRGELLKFQHEEVRVNILHDGVGGVNESDVYLAATSGAIIIAFHVVPEDRAQLLAEREGVEIRRYDIIYEVTQDIKLALEGLLKPQLVEVPTGRALVLQTFNTSRFGTIAGCRVLNGTIERSSRIRVVRDQVILNTYNIQSLRRGKDDTREVSQGLECGIRLENFDDVKEGDILEAFKVQEIKRTL
jgi:translation initiation factor IF-2